MKLSWGKLALGESGYNSPGSPGVGVLDRKSSESTRSVELKLSYRKGGGGSVMFGGRVSNSKCRDRLLSMSNLLVRSRLSVLFET